MKVFPQPSAALCRSRRHSACQPSYHRVYFVLFILFLPFFLLFFFLVVILILQLFHCNFSAVGHILWTGLSRPYGTCSTKQKQMKKKQNCVVMKWHTHFLLRRHRLARRVIDRRRRFNSCRHSDGQRPHKWHGRQIAWPSNIHSNQKCKNFKSRRLAVTFREINKIYLDFALSRAVTLLYLVCQWIWFLRQC